MQWRAEFRISREPGFFLALAFVGMLVCDTGSAHQVSSVSLIANIDSEKKTFLLDAAMEVVPSEDQALNDQISPEEAAREFAEEFLVILFDEQEMKPEIEIDLVDASDEDTPESLQRQQVVVKMPGTIPEGAKEFLLYLDPSCPMAVVMVVIKDNRPARRMQVILAGEYSRPVNVQPVLEEDPFPKGDADADPVPEEEKDALRSEPEGGDRDAFAAGWKSFWTESLLPLALLVGVFLLTTRGRVVFAQVAVLLVFQSFALALGAWGIVGPFRWTLYLLASLVAVISFEAVIHREMKIWRLPLVAVAGAAAGLMLAESALCREVFPDPSQIEAGDVVLFLLGTELAMVAAGIAIALPLLYLSRFSWYRSGIVQPLGALVAAFAIFRIVEPYL